MKTQSLPLLKIILYVISLLWTQAALAGDNLSIKAEKIYFSTGQPNRTIYQKLLWRGGLSLKSMHPQFGGLSGIELSNDGKKLLAVSDRGYWFKADIAYEKGEMARLLNAQIVHLKNSKGENSTYTSSDAEGITKVNGSLDDVIISVEREHALYRYRFSEKGLYSAAEKIGRLNEAKQISNNLGPEAITKLHKSHKYHEWLLVFAEKKLNNKGNHTGWFVKDGVNLPLYVTRSNNYDITDIGTLPNGDIVILERKLSYISGPNMRIRQICGQKIVPDATLKGTTLIDAFWIHSIDNMEGLAVHKAANGEAILTLISDNNYRSWQRNLLLQFTLADQRSVCK